MDNEILPGDLTAGDVTMLPHATDELLVKAIRLGQGGFILTVAPAGGDIPGAERVITLTAAVQLRRRR